MTLTPESEQISQRACLHLSAGSAIHLRGSTGTGKTTLAFHIAAKIGRPVVLIRGDGDLTAEGLIGHDRQVGNVIHSMLQREEPRLASVCLHGHTLIYDEFNRSRPRTNNLLLSVLSEGILALPYGRYLPVHPDFRAIFTSNPDETSGVYPAPAALIDRLVPIEIASYSREAEVQIVTAASKLDPESASWVVDLVRSLRIAEDCSDQPGIRASLAIARVAALRAEPLSLEDPDFCAICRDILGPSIAKIAGDSQMPSPEVLDAMLARIAAELPQAI